MRWLPFLLVLSLCAALLGCQVEVYRGLTEAQVNTMLSTLLKRGIRAEKTAAGKAGFTLSVDEDQLVQSLEILKENNLPRADYENLGKVFSGQGMISSASEEQARMAYAISQELSDTFSRIDGVLTARVHVVLGGTDQATDTRTLPSAAVFLRHTPDSPVVNLVAKIRELTSKAVPDLDYERFRHARSGSGTGFRTHGANPEISRVAARAAEWAAICLDRRGDRLFGGARRTCAVGAFPA